MKGIDFRVLNMVVCGDIDLTLRTLNSAVYYISRYMDVCDAITYETNGQHMVDCIENINEMIRQLRESKRSGITSCIDTEQVEA